MKIDSPPRRYQLLKMLCWVGLHAHLCFSFGVSLLAWVCTVLQHAVSLIYCKWFLPSYFILQPVSPSATSPSNTISLCQDPLLLCSLFRKGRVSKKRQSNTVWLAMSLYFQLTFSVQKTLFSCNISPLTCASFSFSLWDIIKSFKHTHMLLKYAYTVTSE